MSAVLTADKYVARDGGAPMAERTPEQLTKEHLEAVTTVAAFLANCPPDEMWGGRKASEAFESFAYLMQIPPVKLRAAMRPK